MIKVNRSDVIFKQFPNGESCLDLDKTNIDFKLKDVTIDFIYENDSDLIQLMFVKRHIDEHSSLELNSITLNISYMPYSRMDRSHNGFIFTLKYVSEFINSLNFDKVIVHEPHSDVTPALLNNSQTMHPSLDLLKYAMIDIDFDIERDYVFYPDAGAQKRYLGISNVHTLVGFKHRDFATGEILNIEILGNMCWNRKVIILDDLSSYGGTFMYSAQALKDQGAGEIVLAVAHAEDSIFKGKIPKSDLISKVYTTDSMVHTHEHHKIQIVRSLNTAQEI